MNSADKLVGIIADSLNEDADLMERDEMKPNHTPASPAFWFYGLAREQSSLCRSKAFRKLLTPEARAALNRKPSWWRVAA